MLVILGIGMYESQYIYIYMHMFIYVCKFYPKTSNAGIFYLHLSPPPDPQLCHSLPHLHSHSEIDLVEEEEAQPSHLNFVLLGHVHVLGPKDYVQLQP